MDFWGAVLVVVRRWYVVVPLLALTALGTIAAYRAIPTQYLSGATILITAPPTGGAEYQQGPQPEASNPLLLNDSGLDLAATMLIQSMNTAEFAERVGVPTDGSTTLKVNNGTENFERLFSGPFVFVTAESSSDEVARALVQRVVSAADQELRAKQAMLNAPPATYLTVTEIVPPSEPVAVHGSGIRAAAAALGLGLIISLAAAFATESVLQARRRRRAQTGEEPHPTPPTDPAVSPGAETEPERQPVPPVDGNPEDGAGDPRYVVSPAPAATERR